MRLNLSRARTESSEGSALPPAGLPEGDTPWQDQDIIGITLDTLHLLSQWLLLAPAACRRAHLSAHADALKCCQERQRTCKAFEVDCIPCFRMACPESSTLKSPSVSVTEAWYDAQQAGSLQGARAASDEGIDCASPRGFQAS